MYTFYVYKTIPTYVHILYVNNIDTGDQKLDINRFIDLIQ